jgi:hypothetical protein
MLDLDAYPPAKESVRRLIRSGWCLYQFVSISPKAEISWKISGSNGENKICVECATQGEAWHRAIEAAAACGMLTGWPRPKGNRRRCVNFLTDLQ